MHIETEHVFAPDARPTCPHCGFVATSCSSAEGELPGAPVPDDAIFCLGCGRPSVFDGQLRLRVPTAEESREIDEAAGGLRKARALAELEAYRARWLRDTDRRLREILGGLTR